MTLSLFEVAISPSTLAMADGIMVLTLFKVLSIRDSRFAAPLTTSPLVIDESWRLWKLELLELGVFLLKKSKVLILNVILRRGI